MVGSDRGSMVGLVRGSMVGSDRGSMVGLVDVSEKVDGGIGERVPH